jgi:hypothetical protein
LPAYKRKIAVFFFPSQQLFLPFVSVEERRRTGEKKGDWGGTAGACPLRPSPFQGFEERGLFPRDILPSVPCIQRRPYEALKREKAATLALQLEGFPQEQATDKTSELGPAFGPMV